MSELYIPKSALNLKTKTFPQLRIGLQGEPGTGKTWSALTFPNPVVLDIDGGLTAHAGKDITYIPMHDDEFVRTYADGKFKPKKEDQFPNRRDAILHWLRKEGMYLTASQTLILDSWTRLQTAFDFQQELEPKFTNKGAEDDYFFSGKRK